MRPTFRVTARYSDDKTRTYDFGLKFEACDKVIVLNRDPKVVEVQGPVEGTIRGGQFVPTLTPAEAAAQEAAVVAGIANLLSALARNLASPVTL